MMGAGLLAVLGLFVGGLANFAIDRLPPLTDEEWAALERAGEGRIRNGRGKGRQHFRALSWWEFLPLASYVGEARRQRVPWPHTRLRYPAVELIIAGLFAASWLRFEGDPFAIAMSAAFAAVLVALAFIDVETQYLPDTLVLPAVVAALALSPFWAHLEWWEGLAGAGVGFAVFYPIVWFSHRLDREWMGFGDVKLLTALGALLGWQMVLLGIYFGVLAGGLAAIVLYVGGRRGVIAFGQFLILGGLIALYHGRSVLDWVAGWGG